MLHWIHWERIMGNKQETVDISISRKISILEFLARNGALELGQLAKHYGLSVPAMHDELRELFLVEIIENGSGYACPIDITWEEKADPQQIIELLSKPNDKEYQQLSLAEFIPILIVIDNLLNSVDANSAQALQTLRTELVKGAEEAGYADVLWKNYCAPSRIAHNIIIEAISNRKFITFDYYKTTAELVAKPYLHTGVPIEIQSGENPLLQVHTDHGVRSYRLDRISNVQILDTGINVKTFQKLKRECRKKPLDFSGTDVTLYCDKKLKWVAEILPEVTVSYLDNELVLSFSISNIQWLKSLLIKLETYVHCIEPAEIAEAVSNETTALLQHYEENL